MEGVMGLFHARTWMLEGGPDSSENHRKAAKQTTERGMAVSMENQ